MQLYNTKVIPSAIDGLWTPASLPDLTNKKLFVVTHPFSAGSVEEQTFQKMMVACKLQPAEYAVLQIEKDDQLGWQTIVGAGAPKVILLLGILPASLAIQALFRINAPNEFGGYTIIPSLSLAEIENAPAMKKELWTQGLKPLFG